MPKLKKSDCLEALYKNLAEDRKATTCLLHDITNTIMASPQSGKEECYKNIGLVAAKFLETLQKINDETIKMIQAFDKKEVKESEKEATEAGESKIIVMDSRNIYDILEKEN